MIQQQVAFLLSPVRLVSPIESSRRVGRPRFGNREAENEPGFDEESREDVGERERRGAQRTQGDETGEHQQGRPTEVRESHLLLNHQTASSIHEQQSAENIWSFCRMFIRGDNDIATLESDFDYEYNPRVYRGRKHYLMDEISCLEETLAKRRAELREADELLFDCREDLKDARQEVRCKTVHTDSLCS